ncbi:hypothetical protein SEA_ENCELADUS_117 [Mycobacterium phage Enceladus]|uniref:Uncharacterized protein n=1 Tax=Mycobacterium phage DirkDirk TaxID=2664225 RepID=A0A5Q2WEV6_9CAUD|nr:hypothetical protein KNU85_gp101 [Mycobacterium phage DirkDirk]QGH75219.1 hypothetical protein SEA_DIRKDIRK_118 [Mycobacterium phage DirkDirk]UEM46393.1 hypothetical protein SEA_ENCELADUS_117 [Mycobacterium phage Enceladus]
MLCPVAAVLCPVATAWLSDGLSDGLALPLAGMSGHYGCVSGCVCRPLSDGLSAHR